MTEGPAQNAQHEQADLVIDQQLVQLTAGAGLLREFDVTVPR